MGLELRRRQVAEALVQTGGVEPGDVFDDRQLQLRSGAPHAIADELGLEAVDERVREGVVERVADRADDASTAWSSRTWVNAKLV